MALLYLKYTDDKFIKWKGTKGQLIAFANESNETKIKLLNLNTRFHHRKPFS